MEKSFGDSIIPHPKVEIFMAPYRQAGGNMTNGEFK